jgi:hypothetical protein
MRGQSLCVPRRRNGICECFHKTVLNDRASELLGMISKESVPEYG